LPEVEQTCEIKTNQARYTFTVKRLEGRRIGMVEVMKYLDSQDQHESEPDRVSPTN
jgi:hypothetical protein